MGLKVPALFTRSPLLLNVPTPDERVRPKSVWKSHTPPAWLLTTVLLFSRTSLVVDDRLTVPAFSTVNPLKVTWVESVIVTDWVDPIDRIPAGVFAPVLPLMVLKLPPFMIRLFTDRVSPVDTAPRVSILIVAFSVIVKLPTVNPPLKLSVAPPVIARSPRKVEPSVKVCVPPFKASNEPTLALINPARFEVVVFRLTIPSVILNSAVISLLNVPVMVSGFAVLT